MEYFVRLQKLLNKEKEEDRLSYKQLTENLSVAERRANGITWFPIAIRDTEIGHGDYLTLEVERTTHQDVIHNMRFGMSAALFSNHNRKEDRVEGTITYISGNKLKISLRTDELPDWARNGKLGVDAVFDENAYAEMESALKRAIVVSDKKDENTLIKVLTGEKAPDFDTNAEVKPIHGLNPSQQKAVDKIVAANQLAIVHGPPGTGKTTTLIHAIKALLQQQRKTILVVAPSNAAVDLLTEKLAAESLNVVRIGNPARVSDSLMQVTLDHKLTVHPAGKEIKKLKKRAQDFRDMAHKYKRSFGAAEREQRKALYAEARNINKEIERTEEYIIEDTLARADVLTATLIGAAHYTVRHLKYDTVIIDEAGQALEPACWVPILKAKKVVMAGDHNQLPPTIKSAEAAKQGLSITLMEKCVELYPDAVVMLNEQYRMHEAIMQFSSNEFYSGALVANAGVKKRLVTEADAPLLFIDTAGCGFDEVKEGTRISNPEEGHFLLKHLHHWVKSLADVYSAKNFPSIGVVSPYKHQVELLKEGVANFPGLVSLSQWISVNTIDSFQGQERDVIYISMTRSNAESTIGFLSEIRRMNVAMTRARKKLVVIGDSATLSVFPFYADFIQYAQQIDGYVSAWEFMGVD